MDTWKIQAVIPQIIRSHAVEAHGVKCFRSQARQFFCWRLAESPSLLSVAQV